MERFCIDHGDIFSKYRTDALIPSQTKAIERKVDALDDDYVLNIAEEDYINYLVEEYRLYTPVVHFEDAHIETRKVLVDRQYLPHYWCVEDSYEVTMVRYIVPISGDSDLLYFHPPVLFSSGSGRFNVGRSYIYIDILSLNEKAEEVTREYESDKNSCLLMLGHLDKEINSYNRALPEIARKVFSLRKEKIKRENAFVASLGMPTYAQHKPKTYSVPTVSHRYGPPKAPKKTQKEEVLTPVMDTQKYNQILDSIYTMGKMYESFPNITKNYDEETLRDLFLTQIQVSFKSESATGEAFNKCGKTDIMVKHGDGIVFIAECKFWRGKQVFHDAISQLLSYLTWRDTKTALLVFVRGASMSTAINGVKSSISEHPNYKEVLPANKETWLNYRFRMNQDDERLVCLAVMLFAFN